MLEMTCLTLSRHFRKVHRRKGLKLTPSPRVGIVKALQ